MQIAARLASTSLGDILGQLYRARATGTLTLSHDRDDRIHLVAGMPGFLEAGGARKLGDYLPSDRLPHPRPPVASSTLFGEHLVAIGVSPSEVERALRSQQLERLEGLFRLRDARLSFHVTGLLEGRREPSTVRVAPLTPSVFLVGRPRHTRRSLRARDALCVAVGAPLEASHEELKSAFRRMVLELHPDRALADEDRTHRGLALARLLRLRAQVDFGEVAGPRTA